LILYLQKFTDTDDLYLHHRNIYDSIIRQRIAKFPLDLGSFVFLVLIASPLFDKNNFAWELIHHFPPVEGRTQDNYTALCFSHPQVLRIFNDLPYPALDTFLGEFLTDPIRAGKYVLDGTKYALVARFLLDCFIQPCPEQAFLEQVVSWYKLSLEC
jgi:hypothetical protein